MKSKYLAAPLAFCFLTACVSTTPNPIQLSQIGDEAMTCASLEVEMNNMQSRQIQSASEVNGQVSKNIGLGIAGAFLLVPWFFMDKSDAHTVEGKAALARYERLQTFYRDRGCVGREAASPGTDSTTITTTTVTKQVSSAN